jgi:xylulose-5-phosphate/fructose-6-phosphate phosphoketolase
MTATESGPLTAAELDLIDAWWRAANYLSVGQIYLLDNPLLRQPLLPEHVKPRLLGHWGTTPGLNLLYAHLNRVIRNWDLDVIYIAGPGHGGPGLVANTYLEGTYTERYPSISQDAGGMQRLFRQFSFPGGIPSHVAPEMPGSIHEDGELGYSLAHAYGAVFDNPDLIVACVIGDGESETGPLAGSWHSNKFLNPVTDGAVLPILHLNGYKIANPTVPARIPPGELEALLTGYGYHVYTVEGDDPKLVHEQLAAALDAIVTEIHDIQRRARADGNTERPRWPALVLRTPKGWTGPKFVDGHPVEGTWRAHQVPIAEARGNAEHLRQLEEWMRSYRPEELFDASGSLLPEIARLAPADYRRMSDNPHANGGLLLRDLDLPRFQDYAVHVPSPGAVDAESTRVLGGWLRDIIAANGSTFRLFGPDETASNRLDAVFEVTGRAFDGIIVPGDNQLAPDGRVMEVLSEHLCQGWLEGDLLTGRHGLFNCYGSTCRRTRTRPPRRTWCWRAAATRRRWRPWRRCRCCASTFPSSRCGW